MQGYRWQSCTLFLLTTSIIIIIQLCLQNAICIWSYGIAVGVAIRYRFCKDLVVACNIVAGGFMVGHAIHRGFNLNTNDMMVGVVDALIHDSLASVLIPTFITYTVCGSTRECLRNTAGVPKGIYKWAPLTLGLCLLPLMMPPIDRGVSWFMNETVRTLY